VPLSPSTRIGTSVGAIRPSSSRRLLSPVDRPMIPWTGAPPESSVRSRALSRRSRACSTARATTISSSSGSKGFLR
jgi:hypothetical protein